jgi:hypothetical protein
LKNILNETCLNPSYSGGRGRRTESSRTPGAKLARPSQKQNKNTRAEGVAQVVECLLVSHYKTLGSVPSTEGGRKERRREVGRERDKERQREKKENYS